MRPQSAASPCGRGLPRSVAPTSRCSGREVLRSDLSRGRFDASALPEAFPLHPCASGRSAMNCHSDSHDIALARGMYSMLQPAASRRSMTFQAPFKRSPRGNPPTCLYAVTRIAHEEMCHQQPFLSVPQTASRVPGISSTPRWGAFSAGIFRQVASGPSSY